MDSCEAKSGHNDDLDLRMLAYVNTIDPNLMCPICRSPFIEPIRLDCDHTFCMTCLESAFETQNSHIKSCPSCRNKCSDRPRSGTGIPRFVHHLLDEQLVYCPNKACAAKVRREGVLHHVQNLCGFSEISCPSQTCSMTTPRFLSTQDCLHTMINCETCNSKVMKVDIQVCVVNVYTESISVNRNYSAIKIEHVQMARQIAKLVVLRISRSPREIVQTNAMRS